MTIKNLSKLPIIGASLLVLGGICLLVAHTIGYSKNDTVNSKPVAVHQAKQTDKTNTTTATTTSAVPTDTTSVGAQDQPTKKASTVASSTPSTTNTSTQPSTPIATPPHHTLPAPSPVAFTPAPNLIDKTSSPTYYYLMLPYAYTAGSSITGPVSCTILDTPLLNKGIWCNGQTSGSYVSIQYDPTIVSGSYIVQLIIPIDGVTYTTVGTIVL
jgi:hypothetical protein